MTRCQHILAPAIVLLILALSPLVMPLATARTGGASGPDYAALDRYLADQIAAAHLPGAAVGIVHGRQIVHLYATGQADASGRPVTPGTPFVIGSLSKGVTALAIMQLVAAGKVALDTPVRRYLPWFRLADARSSAGITVRQLLIQTSGIPTAAGVDPLRGPVTTLEAQVRALAHVQGAAPGRGFTYSNANYEVLGLIVQTVAGEPYGTYVQRHIFAPLQMQHSTVSQAAAVAAGVAQGHTLWFGLARARPAFYRPDFLPAGWLVSSAVDLTHYLIAQLNGGRYGSQMVLTPAGIAALHRPEVAMGPRANGRYGMGWVTSTLGSHSVLEHDGSSFDMHTFLALDPRTRWGVVVLFNGTSTLYELLKIHDAIGFNVLSRVDGTPASGTLEGFSLVFDLVVLVLTLRQLRTLARLARGRPPGPARWDPLSRHVAPRLPRWVTVVWRVWASFWAPLAIAWEMPRLLGAPWTALVATDIGLWLAIFGALQLLIGLLWLAHVCASQPQEDTARVPALA